MNTPKIYTPKTLAKELKMSVNWVRQLIARDKIKAYKISKRHYIITETEVERFRSSHRKYAVYK